MNTLTLYHGTNTPFTKPDITRSRIDLDFGPGFYLTPDRQTASKWACKTVKSYLMSCALDTNDLRVKTIALDDEWLETVFACRNGDVPNNIKGYDVIVGPIADDRLFYAFDYYSDGLITKEQTIRLMNCMDYGSQYALLTHKAIDALSAIEFKELFGGERAHYVEMYNSDRREAAKRTQKLLAEFKTR